MDFHRRFCYNNLNVYRSGLSGTEYLRSEVLNMKKIIRNRRLPAVLALLLAACLLYGAFAEEEQVFVENEWNYVDGSMDVSNGIPETANGVLARIRETGVLRVGTEPYFAPQEFIDPDREGLAMYAGADMELAKLIAERMGVSLEIIPLDFTEVFRAVNSDECDLVISALSFTPARAITNEMSKGYFFSETPANITMVVREEDAETILTAADLKDRVLVAQRGSLQEAVTVEQILDYQEFRRVALTQEVYEAVRSGNADAGVVDMENAEIYIRNNPGCGLVMVEGIRFTLEDQFAGDRVAAKKGETELLYFVNGVIDEVLEKGLYNEWYKEAQKRAEELDL